MLKVTKISSYGGACPFQLEGELEDGRDVYVRFRWARLRIHEVTPDEGVGGPLLFECKYGEPPLGYMEPENLVDLTKGKFEWPPIKTWDALVDQARSKA